MVIPEKLLHLEALFEPSTNFDLFEDASKIQKGTHNDPGLPPKASLST